MDSIMWSQSLSVGVPRSGLGLSSSAGSKAAGKLAEIRSKAASDAFIIAHDTKPTSSSAVGQCRNAKKGGIRRLVGFLLGRN